MARSLEEVQKDYNIECAKLGQSVYRIEALESEVRSAEKDVEKAKRKLKQLNIEAATLSGQMEAAPAEEQSSESSPE